MPYLTAVCAPISIHALREEGDPLQAFKSNRSFQFLSTPSARRATSFVFQLFILVHISIHALREEGDNCQAHDKAVFRISIHALREEGDFIFIRSGMALLLFLSTPSARRATASSR